jgi:hypothetical protein
MRQIRISKHRRPAGRWPEPQPLDLCDSDIVRAKQLAGRSRLPSAARRSRSAPPDRGGRCAGDRHA